jgi:predicted dehydrogenase
MVEGVLSLEIGRSLNGPQRVLLVGLGYAGMRFKRILDYLRKDEPQLASLCGVVDSDPVKLRAVASDVPVFASFDEAIHVTRPEVVAVCVNEAQHFAVLSRLADSSSVRAVLCEKPLTSDLAQAHRLKDALSGKLLSMNMVERFSPIVRMAMDWLADLPSPSLRRIEYFWGKHRVRDRRPTMGVCSEAIHPLDLIRLIFDINHLTLITSFGVESDLHVSGRPTLDSLFTLHDDRRCPIVGQSSFAWPHRDRRVVGYVNSGSDLYRMTLDFDRPKWDCDRIEIVRIDQGNGIYENVYSFQTSNADYPAELREIFKVKQFIRSSLVVAAGGQSEVKLVDYAEALTLQAIIEELEQKAVRRSASYGSETTRL